MLIAGRYRLRDTIGRGAMGEVWRALDETLGRPVAVKLLLPQDSDPTAADRFRLEAQTAGRLNHPHVVGVLDFGTYEDRLFLVMELVGGDSLARVLSAGGPLPADEVARIAAQAAAGLAAAHQQGIVHRDIKPANLLLDSDGTLKIGDFGIARFVDDPSAALTATGQIVGTSLYLAPERALGRPAGPASDVYALGCVLYQLLTGRPPFQADTALAILHQHLDTAPVPPRDLGVDVPPAFESYLLSMLAKEPADRPTAGQAADWFVSGAWQGRPEPLPPELSGLNREFASATMRKPQPVTAPDATVAGSFGLATDTGWNTTVHRAPSRSSGPRRSRLTPVRRSRAAAVLGGVALFTAALFAGVAWFAPDTGSAQGPGAEPSTTAAPSTPPSNASPAPSHDTASPPSVPSSTSSSPAQTVDAGEKAKPAAPAKSGKGAPKPGGKAKH
ncbi:serine/threonine-protein kinase [Streptomyces mirabilis]|uniref:serine/threonine-protein kinase n=1 Tax=Streptomyces mirabilis TaxID=68239 RepID=UPI0036855DC2